MTPWRPGQRTTERKLETPFEDVPRHLHNPLWRWAERDLLSNGTLVEVMAIELRVRLDNDPTGTYAAYAVQELGNICDKRPDFLLDVVEFLLGNVAHHVSRMRELHVLLAVANSAYAVRADNRGLEMRTTPEVQAQVQGVVDAALGSPGDHLSNAWNTAYSRTPDPVKSYSESVKAVESALAQHVSPQNDRQTLGTMIRDISQKPAKWGFVVADGNVSSVEVILGMMRLIWDGQTSRHGAIKSTREETIDEAQAAVHVAATLVQFGVSGAFTRLDESTPADG